MVGELCRQARGSAGTLGRLALRRRIGGTVPNIDSEQRRVPLARRVSAGLAGLLALLVVLTAIAILIVVDLSGDETRLNDDVPYATAVAAAALNAKSVANDQRGFLLTGDTMYSREAARRAADARREFATASHVAVSDAQRQAVADSRAGFERWWKAAQAGFATYRAGNTQQAIAASVGPDRALRKHYEESLARAQNLGQSSLQSATNGLSGDTTRSVAILLGCLLAALVTGAAIAYWLLRQISAPIFQLAVLLTSDPP